MNRKNGIEATVDIRDRKKGEGVSVFIIHVAAVSCAATQVPEMTLATHKRLKTGFRKAIQIEVSTILYDIHRSRDRGLGEIERPMERICVRSCGTKPTPSPAIQIAGVHSVRTFPY